MACSKETGEGVMENTPRNPAAFSIPASSIAPASRMTGICCLLASCKMPEGTFPMRVCRSDFPSPVMMRSASLIFSAKSRVSKRSSMPGFNCASRNAWRPPPIPPAAPAPGCKDTSLPVVWNMTSERCCMAISSSFTISASAPFWGANTWAAPLGPKKGLRTSHAAVKHAFFSVGWAEELSMELISDRRAPHRAMPFSMLPTSCPSLSKKRNPNACSIPRPASFVALPPSPMTKRRHPRFKASRISSPVPKVVVFIGFLLSAGTSGRPLMAAISTNAVLPSPEMP